MSREQLLQQYKQDVANLRKCAKQLNFSDDEITKIFENCFKKLNRQNLTQNETKAQTLFVTLIKVFIVFIILAISIYILLNVHQPTSSIVLRNVQGLIYPGLKVLRFLFVPIIKRFPQLTGYYDESCLVENPYFYVSDMECWPCENINSVIDLTAFKNYSLYQTAGAPYIVKTEQQEVNVDTLFQFYEANKAIFDRDTKIEGIDLENVFNDPLKSSELHILWRINKMLPGQLIRTLFPRPYVVSERAGQSIERYVMIDGAKTSAYTLPNTECSYVFVIQGSGERTLVLKPSKECGDVCRTVSTVLKPSYVLLYNWWYWRPISLPSENATETSITYINSYC